MPDHLHSYKNIQNNYDHNRQTQTLNQQLISKKNYSIHKLLRTEEESFQFQENQEMNLFDTNSEQINIKQNYQNRNNASKKQAKNNQQIMKNMSLCRIIIFILFSVVFFAILSVVFFRLFIKIDDNKTQKQQIQSHKIQILEQNKELQQQQEERYFKIQAIKPLKYQQKLNQLIIQPQSQTQPKQELTNYITQIPGRQTRIMPPRKDKYKYPTTKQYVYGDVIDYTHVKRIKKFRQSIQTSYKDLERAIKFYQLLGKGIQKDQKLAKYSQLQRDYFNQKYQIYKYQKEIQICLIVTSYDNQRQKRYAANLDSIFQQQYENYFVIYINDFSNDKTGQLVQKYLDQNPYAKSKTTLINNTQNKLKSRNQYEAGHRYCKPGSIMFVCDGDDALIGRQVFKLMNAAYQKHNALFVYLNFMQFKRNGNQTHAVIGRNQPMPQDVIKTHSYRVQKKIPTNPRTWMTDIFLNISYQNYTFKNEFVPVGQDIILMPSLLQLAGDKIVHVPDLVYEYNSGTGLNDHSSVRVNNYRQQLLENIIKLQPLKQYTQKVEYRMKTPLKQFYRQSKSKSQQKVKTQLQQANTQYSKEILN